MIPQRYLLVLGTFLLSLQLYVTRTCIATAKDDITRDMGLSNEQWSWVLASFAFGYALFATPGGSAADRMGARKVLTAVVVAWSIFTAFTAVAWNFVSLCVVRFFFGASEAGAFPGMARVIYSWIPVKERGLVKGINFSGSRLGAAFALPGVAWLITRLGWKQAFLVLMVVGIAWAVFWWIWFRDEPEKKQGLSRKELDYIIANRQDSGSENAPVARLSAMDLFSSANLWLMMIQYFSSNFTFFFSLTWLYPYVKAKYHLEAVHAGFYAMIPLLGGAAGNIFSGWLVDLLYRYGYRGWSRKLPAIVGFVLACVGMVLSFGQESVGGATFWLTLAIFGADMTLSPSWSFCIDIGGKNAGAVSGTMNMAGNLGAAITSLAFAYLPETSRGNVAFFYTAAVLSGLAIVCWLLANPKIKLTHC
jgi:ACS family glucarate transporter-like MFS transporter